MNHQTALKIYEWASYLLIAAATVVFFVLKGHPMGTSLTMVIVAVAVFMRLMMERTRRKASDEENEQLKADLKKLTQLLREKKQGKDN